MRGVEGKGEGMRHAGAPAWCVGEHGSVTRVGRTGRGEWGEEVVVTVHCGDTQAAVGSRAVMGGGERGGGGGGHASAPAWCTGEHGGVI